MNKKAQWVAAGVLALAWIFPVTAEDNGSIGIAAVGPITGSAAARGKDLQEAVQMAVDEANAAGGLNGRKIQLTVYDDGDEPARAGAAAMKIAGSSAVAVLGQVGSGAGIAAGKVYQQERLPAITGAASQSTVTKGNDWFFRLLPDAAGQGRFLADYAKYLINARTAVVLRETGTAGEEFASAWRDRAKTDGIRIAADLEFTPAQANDPAQVDGIVKKLAPLEKGAIVALGTQYGETPQLLRALRDKLGPFTAMGYSSVATDGLSAQFADSEKARRMPGYYTDNLFVAAPQLPDVAEYAQTIFADRFKARYGAAPNPEAVRWYEGAKLIFEAITSTGVNGSDRSTDRRKIRDWLGGLNRPEVAASGVGGPIYFDQDHNVQRGISAGVFYGGHLVSAPMQLTPVTDPAQVPGWDKLVSDGRVIEINADKTPDKTPQTSTEKTGGQKVVKTPVVYAGFEINTLDNVDVRANTFGADFFLWLRYQDGLNLDPHEVEFPTASSGGTLGPEVLRSSKGGFTSVTYHIKGVFRADYEFSRFPFDQQTLRIPVQVRNSSNYSMILAYGGGDAKPPTDPSKSPLTNKLWRIKNQLFYRDVVAYESSFGEQTQKSNVEINRINSDTTIQRDVLGFAVKNFLPLGCILIAVLIGYGLTADVINPRVSIGVTTLLATSVLYQKMAADLPTVTYIIATDYVFFAFFGLCVLFLVLTIVTYELHKSKNSKSPVILNQGGVGLTIVGLIATLIFVWIKYWKPGA